MTLVDHNEVKVSIIVLLHLIFLRHQVETWGPCLPWDIFFIKTLRIMSNYKFKYKKYAELWLWRVGMRSEINSGEVLKDMYDPECHVLWDQRGWGWQGLQHLTGPNPQGSEKHALQFLVWIFSTKHLKRCSALTLNPSEPTQNVMEKCLNGPVIHKVQKQKRGTCARGKA